MHLLSPFVCCFVIYQSCLFFCLLLFYSWDNFRVMSSVSGHVVAWAKTLPWYKATSNAEFSRCTEIAVHVCYPVCCNTNVQDLLNKILQEKKLCVLQLCWSQWLQWFTSVDDCPSPCDCETKEMYTYLSLKIYYTESTIFYLHSFHFF